jgi:pimeloyl-ACP methyl ester carboxylesterase
VSRRPVLLVTSALDDVVDPFSADYLASLLPGPVTRVTLPHSGHVATLGPDLPTLLAEIHALIATPLTRHVRAARHRAGAR